jgi:glycosyltransferase involved in cell wall biosynthesis
MTHSTNIPPSKAQLPACTVSGAEDRLTLSPSPTPHLNRLKVSVLAPDVSGGGMTRVYLVGRVLRSLGCQVEIVGCQFGETIYPPPPAELPVTTVPGKPLPQFMGTARQLLARLSGDVIYAIKPRPTSFGIALLKKLSSHRPVLLDIDDWELSWFGGDEGKYRPTPKQFLRDVLKPDGALRDVEHYAYLEWMESLIPRADRMTVSTHFLQKRFGGEYLPNGKDTDLFNPDRFDADACRAKYGLSNYRVLMFPGTIRPHKGVEDVLQAIDMLGDPDLRLVAVGGRKPDDYEDQLLQQWQHRLIKLPRFPTETMPEVVAAAHAVVVPQRDTATARAQFPIKLTDGMAMAKPIVSTQVGEIPMILADAGRLARPESPEDLSREIRWLLDHPHQAIAMGQRARQRCIKYYSLKAMSAAVAKQLQAVMSCQHQ